MATVVDRGPDTAPVEAYVAAVLTQDPAAIAAVLDDAVEVRALVPRGLREADGPAAAAALISGWFEGAELTVLTREVEAIGDRVHVRYRFRAVEDGRAAIVEQHGFADVAGGRIVKLHLLCSGFRPLEAETGDELGAATTGAHRFDAGALGCGDGLPAAFRERLATLEVGDRLEVVAKDPAAKADLPSLARLMGHRVETTEDLPDGRVRIVVEKGR